MSDEANSSDRLEAAASTPVRRTASMRLSCMSATDALGAQASTRAVANAISPDVDRSIAALAKVVMPELTGPAEALSKSVMPDIKSIVPSVESVMPNVVPSVMPNLLKQVGIGITGKLGYDMSKVGIGALPKNLGIAAMPKMGLDMPKTLGLAGMKVGPDWSKVTGALTGSLSEQFAAIAGRQQDIEELFDSPALARAASWPDVMTRHSEELESSMAEIASTAVERNARQDAAAEAAVATAEAVGQLLAVSQAQQAQFGVMTGVLQTLADQGIADSAAARSRFWWGFSVGAATLAVTIAVLWLTVLMWQAAAGG